MRVTQTTPHPDPLFQVAALSDLFFNYECPHYNAFLTNDSEGDDRDGHDGLLKDAEEFSAMLKNATGFELAPADLVTDYFNRL